MRDLPRMGGKVGGAGRGLTSAVVDAEAESFDGHIRYEFHEN